MADDEPRRGEHVDVVALVLGDPDARERTAMAAHLAGCDQCRLDYEEAADALAELLPAVPAVQPPIGFEQRTLSRLGVSSGAERARPRRRSPWVLAAAAAVLLVAVVGVLVAVDDDSPATVVATLHHAGSGAAVGTVSLGQVGGDRVMVVDIDDAPDGVSYRCHTTFADGTTYDSDPWPAGNGAWIVRVGDHPVRVVELRVEGTDQIWSTATFERT